MGQQSGREYQGGVPAYLRYLLKLAWVTQEQMFEARKIRNSSNPDPGNERQAVDEFKDLLEKLWFRYEPKFDHKDNVSVDSDVKKKLDDGEVADLSFNECEQLCEDIRDLMEELGHTRFEGVVFNDEGIGTQHGA